MSRIEELVKEMCPEGVKYVPINTVCEIYDGTHSTPKYMNQGIRFVSVENIGNLYASEKYISEEDYCKFKITPQINDIFMTRIGSIGVCTIVDREEPLAYYVSLALLRPNTEILNSYFLKYAIESFEGQKELYKRTLVNAVPIKVNKDDIGKILVPMPPLDVQQEIVRILDKFTELEAELQTELEARKKQYEYYREAMLSFNDNIEIVTLDKCADIGTGSSNTVDGIDDGVYPFFVRSQKPLTMNKFEYDEIATITAGDGVGVGKVFHFIYVKYALHKRAYRIHITDKRINPKFFHYYFVTRFPKFIFGNMYEGSVPSIRRPMLNKFEVPIPSMEEQNRIVDILDKFEEYCNNEENGLPAEIAARHKQYEYYRDKLLTFERKVV